jgi:hypothetical protein
MKIAKYNIQFYDIEHQVFSEQISILILQYFVTASGDLHLNCNLPLRKSYV